MKKKRAISNTPTPKPGESPRENSAPTRERMRDLDAAIKECFDKLRRLLDQQQKDLGALHSLRTADRLTESSQTPPPADPDLAWLTEHWQTLPQSVRRQIIDAARASGVRESNDTNTIQEEPK